MNKISLQELKRKLTEMFSNENLYPIFFEVYKKHHKFSHMQLECIPLPKEIGESAPIYFKVSVFKMALHFIFKIKYKLLSIFFYRKLCWNVKPNGLLTRKLLI